MTPALLVAIIVGIVIIFAILKFRSVTTVSTPPVQVARGPAAKPFTGEYSGVGYSVENLSEEFITVEIEAPRITRPLELNMRSGTSVSVPENDDRRGEIEALARLGAVYFDIGYNTTRVAVEFPTGSVNIDRGFAEKVVSHLTKLRERS